MLSFPPFNLWYLSFFAFVPLIVSLEDIGSLKIFVSGLIFNFLTLYWIYGVLKNYGQTGVFFAVVLLLLLLVYLSIYFFIPFLFLKKTRNFLLFPFVFVFFEILLERLFTGFPWNSLGYTQGGNNILSGLFFYGGLYSVSLLIVIVNVLICLLLKRRKAIYVLFILVLFIFCVFLYLVKANKYDDEGVKVSIVQGNASMDTVWSFERIKREEKKYFRMTKKALKGGAKIVVWPEFSFPLYPEYNLEFREKIYKLAKKYNGIIVFGAIRRSGDKSFNTVFVFYPDERYEFYDKIHLTPFGEYIPFLDLFKKFAKTIANVEGEFTGGTRIKVFEFEGKKFFIPICYEMLFPELIYSFYKKSPDFIITVTNDSWFGKTSAPFEHFNIARVRAMETGLFVVRAATSGVSGIISGDGKVIKKSEIFSEELVSGEIYLKKSRSFFYKNYYFFFWGYFLLGMFSFVYGLVFKKSTH